MLNSAEVMTKVTNKDIMTQDRSLIYDDQVCKALKYAECLHVTRKYGMVVCNDDFFLNEILRSHFSTDLFCLS